MTNVSKLVERLEDYDNCNDEDIDHAAQALRELQARIDTALYYLRREGTPYVYTAIAALEGDDE